MSQPTDALTPKPQALLAIALEPIHSQLEPTNQPTNNMNDDSQLNPSETKSTYTELRLTFWRQCF